MLSLFLVMMLANTTRTSKSMWIMSQVIRDLVETKRLPSLSARKELRKSARLTLADLAGQAGVTKQTVWLWEAGRTEPRGSNRLAYVKILDELKELL